MAEDKIPFEPKALREGEEMEFRFKIQAEKALERYKIVKRLELRHRMRQMAIDQMEVEGYSDAMGMYIIDTAGGKEKKDGSDTTSYTVTVGFRDGIASCMRKFFKNMYTDTKFELNWKQFLSITLCLQVSFLYILKHLWLVCQWGALLVLLVYVVFGAFIAMPIYMILMFMGNYSRNSYIKFWECIPLLKGVGYAIALTAAMAELFMMVFGGIALNYVIDIATSSHLPWLDCKFDGASEDCRPSDASDPYTTDCCIFGKANCSEGEWHANIYKFGAYDYFKMNQLKDAYDTSTTRMLSTRCILIVGLMWLMMFLMMMMGLRRFRGFMTTISIILLVVIFIPWVMITLYTNEYRMFNELDANYMDFFSYEFWIEVSVHSLHREMAGDVITFSAVSRPGISPTIDTVCIYILKLAFILLISVWMSIGVAKLQARYQILHSSCIDVNGITTMFCIFPEILSHNRVSRIGLVLYFAVIFFWCFAGSVYTLNSLIGALLEEFPKLIKVKVVLCGIFCVLCYLISLSILRSDLEDLYVAWVRDNCIQMKVTLLIYTLIGLFLYSLNRISNDYHFTYGQKLQPYWLHGLKVGLLLIAIIGVLRLSLMSSYNEVSSIVACVFLNVPTFIGAVVGFIRYKTGLRATIISPDPNWGPHTYKKKLARTKFDPKRELRYRSSIQKCNHSCLLNSPSLSSEMKYWTNKRTAMTETEMETNVS